mmetsp:Transcript_77574/g.169819  ORF Transcript_77574/g.169819 Transcript_77574/m.169819 type:complete len:376 (-) Transcript_77574:751-1878(-)
MAWPSNSLLHLKKPRVWLLEFYPCLLSCPFSLSSPCRQGCLSSHPFPFSLSSLCRQGSLSFHPFLFYLSCLCCHLWSPLFRLPSSLSSQFSLPLLKSLLTPSQTCVPPCCWLQQPLRFPLVLLLLLLLLLHLLLLGLHHPSCPLLGSSSTSALPCYQLLFHLCSLWPQEFSWTFSFPWGPPALPLLRSVPQPRHFSSISESPSSKIRLRSFSHHPLRPSSIFLVPSVEHRRLALALRHLPLPFSTSASRLKNLRHHFSLLPSCLSSPFRPQPRLLLRLLWTSWTSPSARSRLLFHLRKLVLPSFSPTSASLSRKWWESHLLGRPFVVRYLLRRLSWTFASLSPLELLPLRPFVLRSSSRHLLGSFWTFAFPLEMM